MTHPTAMPKDSKPALTPKLRFPEFQHAPAWQEKSLGSLGKFTRGLTYSTDDVTTQGLPVLRSTNIQDGTLVLDRDLVFVSKTCPDSLRLQKGDIVICMSNGSKALVGKSAEYFGDYPGDITVGAFCSFFRPELPFSKIAFQTSDYARYVGVLIAGGNINNLNNSVLEEFRFPIPPSSAEQQKIAECLSTLDELIEAESRKLDALKDHKKGLMQQLFPREGETRPRLRFPEFRSSPDWTTRRMNEIYAFLANNSFSRDRLNYVSGSIKNIHYGDIHKHYRLLFDVTREVVPYINDDALTSESQPVFCAEGDMVFADASEDLEDIGKCIEIVNLNNERVVAGLHTILARPKTRSAFARGFSGYLFSSKRIRAQIQKESQGTKVLGISAKRLANIELCFPVHVAEQERIADCLSSLDDLIAAQSERLEALRAHKRGLMQQLFPNPSEFES